jgi:flagellar motility protein MotE (MotC chaperone)
VCDCNSKKLIKTNKNGKVVKGDIPDATKLIDEMLKDKFEERDAILNAQAKKQQEIFDSYTQDSTKNP